jgi:hypothetical protein
MPYDYLDMQYVYQQFPCRDKMESSFRGLCAKVLNLVGQRFSFTGEEYERYRHDKIKAFGKYTLLPHFTLKMCVCCMRTTFHAECYHSMKQKETVTDNTMKM